MIIGMPILAMLLAMLTVKAEVGGLPLPQDRYRRSPLGGPLAKPGGGPGPGGPIPTRTSTTPKTTSPGPKGPGSGGPIATDSSGDPSGLKGDSQSGATPQRDYYKRWRLEKELADKFYVGVPGER